MFELLMLAGLMGAALSTFLPDAGRRQDRGDKRRKTQGRATAAERKNARSTARRIQAAVLRA